MSPYNELPFVVVNNNGVDVKVYDVDLDKYVINESKVYKNISYVSLDGNKEGRMKTRPYAQYTGLTGRTGKSPVMLERRPDYFGCTLDEQFSTFDKWVEWAETKVGFMCTDENGDVYQLDKDLMNLPEKNKHYSPHNCVFLPREINSGLSNLPRMRNLETKRKVFIDAFDKYFETLDEDALGKLIEICGHKHGLNEFEVTTEDVLLLRSKYGSFFSKIDNWEDEINLDYFSFTNGEYSYKSVLKTERRSTAKEVLLHRLETRLHEIEKVLEEFLVDKESNLGKWWRLKEIETMLRKKLRTHKDMITAVNTGEIKLPHYVLTWV